ncbi:MAG: GTPase HflX [Clostridia bacterium]|nr:GTPase HflX [Clostridia bacterium]MBR6763726.1 GTPase HflX [Clostridia bacterium]
MVEKIKNTLETKEKAIIVGLNCRVFDDEENSSEESLEELSALVDTAGGEVVASVLQNRGEPDVRCYIGEGKAREIAELARNLEAELIVFDNELAPSQAKVLEQIMECRILDRSGLILDIFAGRARTAEGKLQVELAQYKYLLPRLTGMWGHLVRQTASGGKSPIGTRGPGETQLETDRRHVRIHMQRLERALADVRRVREQQRKRRLKNDIPVVAIVGYTNAGKSTLLNRLTGSNIQANNRLFDTLDTSTRHLKISDACEVVISDTVGFIRRLPHHLIEAFKATLEELQYADLILHVIDVSNPDWMLQAKVTEKLCDELAPEGVKRIAVLNKADACPPEEIPNGGLLISARTGENIDELLRAIEQEVGREMKAVSLHLPYANASILDLLKREAIVKSFEYLEDGIKVDAVCNLRIYGRVKEFAAEA